MSGEFRGSGCREKCPAVRLIIFCGFILKVDSNHVLVSGMNQINMRIPHEKTVRQNIQQNNQTQLAQVKSDRNLVNKIQLGKVVRCWVYDNNAKDIFLSRR